MGECRKARAHVSAACYAPWGEASQPPCFDHGLPHPSRYWFTPIRPSMSECGLTACGETVIAKKNRYLALKIELKSENEVDFSPFRTHSEAFRLGLVSCYSRPVAETLRYMLRINPLHFRSKYDQKPDYFFSAMITPLACRRSYTTCLLNSQRTWVFAAPSHHGV